VLGVEPKRLVGVLAAGPLAHHQQVPRIVDVDHQLVAKVAAKHGMSRQIASVTARPSAASGAGNRDSQIA
jgi:hypothetical protein